MLSLYSRIPEPLAFTTMVPVGIAHVGCVTDGMPTVGTSFTDIEPLIVTLLQPPVSVTV